MRCRIASATAVTRFEIRYLRAHSGEQFATGATGIRPNYQEWPSCWKPGAFNRCRYIARRKVRVSIHAKFGFFKFDSFQDIEMPKVLQRIIGNSRICSKEEQDQKRR